MPKLNKTRSWTIRWRLTAWYSISSLMVLLAAGTIAYAAFRASLIHDTDRSLTIKGMEVIYMSVGSELTMRHGQYINPPAKTPRLMSCIAAQFNRDASDPLGDPIYMRLFSTNPACLVAVSHNVRMHDLVQRTLGPTLTIDPGETVSGAIFGDASFDQLRVVSIRIPRQPYILQLATPWKRYEDILDPIIAIISGIIIFGFALSAVGGWILVGQTLRPISEIVAEAAAISGNDDEPEFIAARSSAKDEIGDLVSALNAMMARVHQSIVAQRRFTADTSHDLGTPLAILRGELELALTRNRSEEEYRRVIISSLEETERLIRIISDLRELATAEFEKEYVLHRLPVDLVKLIENVVHRCKYQAEKHNVSLSLSIPNHIQTVTVLADESAIERALLNLVDNAVYYNVPLGRVKISLQTRSGEAVITVTDTGIGIDANECKAIFDRFYRTDKSRCTNGLRDRVGSGLGLAIVKSIIAAHGGTISVESEVGRGSEFTIFLVLAQNDITGNVETVQGTT